MLRVSERWSRDRRKIVFLRNLRIWSCYEAGDSKWGGEERLAGWRGSLARSRPSRGAHENRLGFALFYGTLERSFRIVCSHNNLRAGLLVGWLPSWGLVGWLAGGTNKKCSIYVASCEIGAVEIRETERKGGQTRGVEWCDKSGGEVENVHEEYVR